jgi:hypothetical protein
LEIGQQNLVCEKIHVKEITKSPEGGKEITNDEISNNEKMRKAGDATVAKGTPQDPGLGEYPQTPA